MKIHINLNGARKDRKHTLQAFTTMDENIRRHILHYFEANCSIIKGSFTHIFFLVK